MTLTELLEIQRELNTHCKGEPTDDKIVWAILDELGEFARSRKGAWAWWTKYGHGFWMSDRTCQAEKIAGILRLSLTDGLILNQALKYDDSVYDFWEDGWVDPCPTNLTKILGQILCRGGLVRVEAIAWLARYCGFPREEIEAAYLAKAQEDKRRWLIAS